MSRKIIQKREIPAIQIKQLFAQLKEYLPQWLLSPTMFITVALNLFNEIIIVICYLILLGQTARLMVSQQKYVNIKVLMTKWIIFLFFDLIFIHIQKDNFQGSIFKTIFVLAVLSIIYPSQASKLIFQKYFKDQEILKESSPMRDSYILNNDSLFQKFLVFFTIQLLKIVKYVITFINPLQRKSIDEEIKNIKQIITKHKYFWKPQNSEYFEDKKQIQEILQQSPKFTPPTNAKPISPKVQPDQTKSTQFVDSIQKQLAKSIAQQKQKQNQNQLQKSRTQVRTNDLVNSTFSMKNQSQVMKSKKYKTYSVSQYLPLFSTANRSSMYPNSASKRCTYYRQAQISYDVNSAVMTVTSLEDMKVSYRSLEQIVLLEEQMVQFDFEDQQQMIVKFKTKTEFDEFISSIESNLQK